ncbi:MAG: hypothetical protein RMY16_25785 [Nostoc sp. DedQUE12b]|nr:hypothetical protein [Nostoc sp. DedQUE12b]MDZ8088930.1 hypothetical protein [Nostoc sp. DedQUE12b]
MAKTINSIEIITDVKPLLFYPAALAKMTLGILEVSTQHECDPEFAIFQV